MKLYQKKVCTALKLILLLLSYEILIFDRKEYFFGEVLGYFPIATFLLAGYDGHAGLKRPRVRRNPTAQAESIWFSYYRNHSRQSYGQDQPLF
jgi:hypothetical protein